MNDSKLLKKELLVLYPVEEAIRIDKARFIQMIKTWNIIKQNNKIKVLFLCRKFDVSPELGLDIKLVPWINLSIRNIKFSWKKPFLFSLARSIIKLSKGYDKVVIYTRYRDSFIFLKLILPSRKFNFVYLFEEPVFMREKSFKKMKIKLQEKFIVSRANLIVAVSPILQSIAFKHFRFAKPMLIAGNGADPVTITKKQITKKSDHFLVGYLGSIHSGKGTKLIDDVLNDNSLHFTLKIVGGNEPKRDRQGKLEITGWLKQSDAINEVVKVDVALLPTVEQTMFLSPMKLFDYLSIGLPIVYSYTEFAGAILNNKVAICALKEEDFAIEVRNLLLKPCLRRKLSLNSLRIAPLISWDTRASKIVRAITKISRD